MKKVIVIVLAVLAVLGLYLALNNNSVDPSTQGTISTLNAAEIPEASGFVNDHADILNRETRQYLEDKLKNQKPEIAVLTVNSTGNLDIEQYGIKVAEKWKVGDADKDDGVIFIVDMGAHKVRIEVGYGSEGKIPDAKAGRILDENVLPYFSVGDWDGGIVNGVDRIIKELK